MSAQEFWALAPVQYYALLERHNVHEEWQDWRAAQVAQVIANAYRDRKKQRRPFSVRDFMPHRRARPEHKQTSSEILSVFQALAASFKGNKKGKSA